MIIADKPVTVQYGALYGNERDGGGYVPSSNGSSTGDLFYFLVPFQATGEQEIRIVSWDDGNSIQLDRYVNGNWVAVKSLSLNKMKVGDWAGKNDGNVTYAPCFRINIPVWLNGFYLMVVTHTEGRTYTTKVYIRKER